MKRLFLTFLVSSGWYSCYPQELSLQECIGLALQNSPLDGQTGLYEELASAKVERIGTALMPQVSLNAQWSYQSDVFALPFSPPGTDVPQIPKSQYQATVGIEQSIFDGGMVRQSKEAARREFEVNRHKTETDLYKLKEGVAALYFGILRAQETQKNLENARRTLLERKKEVDAGYNNGILLLSDKASFEKEILSLEQQLISVAADKEALFAMLADKLGQPLGTGVELAVPSYETPEQAAETSRPEVSYLAGQQMLINQNTQILKARGKPKLNAFARGGAGSPNPYNFFETDLSGFYVAGVRLYWTVFDWGANKQEQQELLIQEKILETTRQDVLRQFENGMLQWRQKWEAAEEIISRDAQIVKLQESIVSEYSLRLEGGTITSADYIAALDQLTRAKTTARMHEIDRVWYQVQYLTLIGKL